MLPVAPVGLLAVRAAVVVVVRAPALLVRAVIGRQAALPLVLADLPRVRAVEHVVPGLAEPVPAATGLVPGATGLVPGPTGLVPAAAGLVRAAGVLLGAEEARTGSGPMVPAAAASVRGTPNATVAPAAAA